MLLAQLNDLDTLLDQLQSVASNGGASIGGLAWMAMLTRFLSAALIAAVFWLVAVILSRMVRRVGEARGLDVAISGFISRLLKLTLILIGIVTGLGTAGVDVSAMVAGLGLLGFALAFALKDAVSNLTAGIMILVYKPFYLQDEIKVSNISGTVSFIDLRYTVLLCDGKTVLLPNSLVLNNAVTVDKKSPPSVET